MNLPSVYGPSLDISELKQLAKEKVNTELANATGNLHSLISVLPLNTSKDKKINKTNENKKLTENSANANKIVVD